MSNETLTQQLPPVRVTQQEKLDLQLMAQSDGRSLSNYIRRVLMRHIQSVKHPTSYPVEPDRQYSPQMEQLEPRIDTTRTTGINESPQVTAELVEITPITPVNTANEPEIPKTNGKNPATGWSTGRKDTHEPDY